MSRVRSQRPVRTLTEPLTGRSVFAGRTRSGMEVWVAPMGGFHKIHALLGVRFGSMDDRLPDGTPLPAGTAHFLEHKMFETPDGDAFDLYAARGAGANAYTTNGATAYVFSCTSRFEENLATLLETVQTFQADAASVEREKSIIEQEIAMYADDPHWRGSANLLTGLYVRHPVRHDVVGSPESIAAIDRDLLDRAHEAYYHPRNLVLAVAGNVDPDEVLGLADDLMRRRGSGGAHRRPAPSEPRRVARRETIESLSVSRPHVYLGLKDVAPGPGRRLLRRQVHTAMVLDALFEDGGSIQAPLYDEGVADDSFQAGYDADVWYGHAMIMAEVDEWLPFRRRLDRALSDAAVRGLTDEEVRRARRRLLGRHLRTFNAPERLGGWLLGVALSGTGLDVGVRAAREATARGLTRRLRDLLARPQAWSVITGPG